MTRSFAILSVAILGCAVGVRAQGVPLPPDPHELATGHVQVPSTPSERAAALSLLERAKQNAEVHAPGGSPFNIRISFNSTGAGNTFSGPGSMTELWFSGRQWRYDQNLASYSETRLSSQGRIVAKATDSLPLHVSMLRAAMFAPIGGNPSNSLLRIAPAQWEGRAVSCFLLSGNTDRAAAGRQWDETEYCVDNASGLLQIFSRAPGTYVVYGYKENLQFHGRQVPDQVTIFVSGSSVLDAKVAIEDANPADAKLTAATGEMAPTPVNDMNVRFPMPAKSPLAGSFIKPVIVNAVIDKQGKVVEAEVGAASDPALASPALDMVRSANFGPSGTWRQAYINVQFSGTH